MYTSHHREPLAALEERRGAGSSPEHRRRATTHHDRSSQRPTLSGVNILSLWVLRPACSSPRARSECAAYHQAVQLGAHVQRARTAHPAGLSGNRSPRATDRSRTAASTWARYPLPEGYRCSTFRTNRRTARAVRGRRRRSSTCPLVARGTLGDRCHRCRHRWPSPGPRLTLSCCRFSKCFRATRELSPPSRTNRRRHRPHAGFAPGARLWRTHFRVQRV